MLPQKHVLIYGFPTYHKNTFHSETKFNDLSDPQRFSYLFPKCFPFEEKKLIVIAEKSVKKVVINSPKNVF